MTEFSGSRDVIGHVTFGLAVCDFVREVNCNGTSILNGYGDMKLRTLIALMLLMWSVCCSDITLRVLIDDRYCGRIIGRDGKTVKKIREDTGTRISISKYVSTALLSK